MANYYYLEYDARVTAVFAEGEIITVSGTGSGTCEIIDVIPTEDVSGEGYLYVADLGSLSLADNAVLTSDGGGVAAQNDTNIPSYQTKYPAFMRKDVTVATAATGDIRWDTSPAAPPLYVTHSFQYDGLVDAIANGDVLLFSGGGTGEVIAGGAGGAANELQIRLITLPLPLDNETITDAETELLDHGAVNGVLHDRTYTPLHLHRFLGDLGDDEVAEGDDLYDITDTDASARSTDTIITLQGNYNVDQTLIEHMYGGSIDEQDGTRWSGLAISLTVNNPDTNPIVIQDDGTGEDAIVTNRWKNAYNPDALKGQVRILIKTVDAGTEINGSRVRVRIMHYGDTSFLADATLGTGETGVSLFSSSDLNNQTAEATIAALLVSDPPTAVENYQEFDYLNGNGLRPFHLSYDIDPDVSRGDFYEQTKYIASNGSGETIYGRAAELFVGADLNFDFTGNDGTPGYTEGEILSFAGGAKAMLLACDTPAGATGTMWCQLLSGTASQVSGAITGGTSSENSASVTTSTIETRTINTHYLGQYTGTGFITNFGIAFVVADGTKNDKFADLLGAVQAPPNNVTFTLGGLAANEDYIIGAENDGAGAFNFNQFKLDGVHAGLGTVTIGGAGGDEATIPSDTPTSGTIRVLRADGKYERLPYSSWSGVTFTLDGVTCTAADLANCFISYIDTLASGTSESFSYIYSVGNGDRDFVFRARDGKASPTKTSPATGTMSDAGGNTSINRVSDA
jgi:hypothetical protein